MKELAEFPQTKVAGNGQMQAYPMVTPGCNKVGKCCVTTYNKTPTDDQVVSLTHLHKDICRRYRSRASCLAWNNYNLHISTFFFKSKYILCSSCLGNLQMHILSDNESIILTGSHFSRWPGSREKLILGSVHVHRQWLWSPIITLLWIASSVHVCISVQRITRTHLDVTSQWNV